MTATATQIAQVRRMTAEPDETTYNDEDVAGYIETYPVIDDNNNIPDDDDWAATYDLHAAAGDIWEEKAAAAAGEFDFAADGGNYSRSQKYEQYMKQARWHRARRRVSTLKLIKSPEEPVSQRDRPWIANLPEED